MTSPPIDRVLAHFQGVRRTGNGYVARCSHHDDRHASLSVREGDDRRVLLHCHAGCSSLDVVQSAGLSMVDLFPPGSRERRRPRVWAGIVPFNSSDRPSLESWGDDVASDMLGELARLAHVRGTLDQSVVAAVRKLASALGVSHEHLVESVRVALAGDGAA